MSTRVEKIKQRGYWHVVFHPGQFSERRIPRIQDLHVIIREAAVEFRGWDFPHLSQEGPTIGTDWIEDDVDWSEHVETWRLYQSGQFVFYGGIRTDWLDQSLFERPSEQWRPGLFLPVTDTVFRFTEVFELAARLATGPIDGDTVRLAIKIVGLGQRELWMDNRRRIGFHHPRKSAIAEFPQTFDLPRDRLVAETRQLAVTAAGELFTRFNWTPESEFLTVIQGELFRR